MKQLKIIGQSPGIQEVQHLILQVAKTQANVMVLGESGTGKELVARIVHLSSSRSDKPFIPVNCAAIPLELLESELFGHEKGSFTGAHVTRQGKFESANGGTLFLDEIGDMPLVMQAKLLRVLQERCFERVGGNKPIQANVRVIAATHKNLLQCIQQGTFREDLYYRLNVFPIEIPPLRTRKEDIPVIIEYFIDQYCSDPTQKISLSSETLDFLENYPWPGNVRELANLIERMVILYPGKMVEINELPEQFFRQDMGGMSGINGMNGINSFNGTNGINGFNSISNINGLNAPKFQDKNFTILTAENLPKQGFDLKEYLAQLEFAYIHHALDENGGIVSHAAKSLGLRRTTLVEKMKKYKIGRGLKGVI